MIPLLSRRKAYDYAERIRARLPLQLQKLRAALGLSKYALALIAGVSRDMIGAIERGDTIPSLYILAKLASGVRMTLTEFLRRLEDA